MGGAAPIKGVTTPPYMLYIRGHVGGYSSKSRLGGGSGMSFTTT